jgi:hypothetical protein
LKAVCGLLTESLLNFSCGLSRATNAPGETVLDSYY